MFSARDAEKLTMFEGGRLQKIQTQEKNIENFIKAEAKLGKRRVELDFEIFEENLESLIFAGYKVAGIDKKVIRW